MSPIKALTVWKSISAFWFVVAVSALGFALNGGTGFFNRSVAVKPATADGFEAFEGIAFAREFSERFQTFEARTFKVSQIATAFLLDDNSRAQRIGEIERLEDKIVRGEVSQRARLMNLERQPGASESFRADLDVELREGLGERGLVSEFKTRLHFDLERVDRTSQNPWGFRVAHLRQEVIANAAPKAPVDINPLFHLRVGTAVLVRFPCSIENVELAKGTSVRVKLTTFDISELQLKTEQALSGEQSVKAVCRDHEFKMRVAPEISFDASLTVLKTLKMENSVPIVSKSELTQKKKNRAKSGVEKSIEEQLGFIVEE